MRLAAGCTRDGKIAGSRRGMGAERATSRHRMRNSPAPLPSAWLHARLAWLRAQPPRTACAPTPTTEPAFAQP